MWFGFAVRGAAGGLPKSGKTARWGANPFSIYICIHIYHSTFSPSSFLPDVFFLGVAVIGAHMAADVSGCMHTPEGEWSEPESDLPSPAEAHLGALPEEIAQHVLRILDDGEALCHACAVCRAWRRLASAEPLWKSVTLTRHSWLTRRTPTDTTWKEYYAQLATCQGASFVVLGGAYSAKGRRYSLRTGEWSDTPPLSVERRGAALLRNDDGYLCARALAHGSPSAQSPRRVKHTYLQGACKELARGPKV